MAKAKVELNPEQEDARFVQNVREWPRWPILPLKRRYKNHLDVQHFCGFMIEEPVPPYRVYLGYMYQLANEKKITDFPTEEFASLESLVQEWKID